jgi:DNA-binding response OmpR family regulator
MQKHILVVTHDLSLLATRSSLLLKAGYAVHSASNGDSALHLLEKEKIDLVVIGRNSLSVSTQID